MVGNFVLLYNSRLRWFPDKLKSKWTGPYLVTQLFPHGAVELETKEGVRFKVNGQCIKIYFGHAKSSNEVIEVYHLDEVRVIKCFSHATTLNQALVRRQPNTYSFLSSNCSIFY